MKKSKGFKIAAMICIAVGIVALLALVVMYLWNWLIPAIFVGGPMITFWQALGLMILAKILFGGFKPPAHACSADKRDHWRDKLRDRMTKMDPEKKKKFLHRMHARFHGIDPDKETLETEQKE